MIHSLIKMDKDESVVLYLAEKMQMQTLGWLKHNIMYYVFWNL